VSKKEQTILAYACAGCADVGEIADQVCRKLRKDGFASSKHSCIVGIGAGLTPFIDAAKNADMVVTVDGCEIACGQKLIEKIGLQPRSVILTQLGLEKGKTALSPDLTSRLCQTIADQFAATETSLASSDKCSCGCGCK
jgi:uncharacterized metal-binding protein